MYDFRQCRGKVVRGEACEQFSSKATFATLRSLVSVHNVNKIVRKVPFSCVQDINWHTFMLCVRCSLAWPHSWMWSERLNTEHDVEWNCNLLVMSIARDSHYEILQNMHVTLTQIENCGMTVEWQVPSCGCRKRKGELVWMLTQDWMWPSFPDHWVAIKIPIW